MGIIWADAKFAAAAAAQYRIVSYQTADNAPYVSHTIVFAGAVLSSPSTGAEYILEVSCHKIMW